MDYNAQLKVSNINIYVTTASKAHFRQNSRLNPRQQHEPYDIRHQYVCKYLYFQQDGMIHNYRRYLIKSLYIKMLKS